MAKRRSTKPEPIPNVVPSVLFQIIDGRNWKTISEVIDAPIPIRRERERLLKLGYCNLWVRDCCGSRRPLF